MSFSSADVEPAKYAADDDQHKGRLKLHVPWINPGWPRGELSDAELIRQYVLPPMLAAAKRLMPTEALVMALKAPRSKVEPNRQHTTSGYSGWWYRAKVKFIWGEEANCRVQGACKSKEPPEYYPHLHVGDVIDEALATENHSRFYDHPLPEWVRRHLAVCLARNLGSRFRQLQAGTSGKVMETFRERTSRLMMGSDIVSQMKREIYKLEARASALDVAIEATVRGSEIMDLYRQRDLVFEQVMQVQRRIWEAERLRWRPRAADVSDITGPLEHVSVTIRIERVVSFFGMSKLDPLRRAYDDGAQEHGI